MNIYRRKHYGRPKKTGLGPWPPPWGPHCFLRQGRHPGPASKLRTGALRRAERLHKLRHRRELLDAGPERDDGWIPLQS